MNAVLTFLAVCMGVLIIGLAIVSPVIMIVCMLSRDREREESEREKMDWTRKARAEDLETADRNLLEAEKRNDPEMVIFWANAKDGIEKRGE
ncbi:MAG: hypothetical protein ABFD66_02105 [Smithella sp.]